MSDALLLEISSENVITNSEEETTSILNTEYKTALDDKEVLFGINEPIQTTAEDIYIYAWQEDSKEMFQNCTFKNVYIAIDKCLPAVFKETSIEHLYLPWGESHENNRYYPFGATIAQTHFCK